MSFWGKNLSLLEVSVVLLLVAWRLFCKYRTRSSEKNVPDDDVERLALLNSSDRSLDFTKAMHRSQGSLLGSSDRSMTSTKALQRNHASLSGRSERSTRTARSVNRIHAGSGLGGGLGNSTSSMTNRHTSPVSVVDESV
jgi:hypothetical protein